MAYVLAGSNLPEPSGKQVKDSIQIVSHRTAGGKFVTHYLGQSKKVITLTWEAISSTDLAIIEGHRTDQVLNGTPKNLWMSDIGFSHNVTIIGDVIDYNIPRTYSYLSYSITCYEV